jgi:hypothetical protein
MPKSRQIKKYAGPLTLILTLVLAPRLSAGPVLPETRSHGLFSNFALSYDHGFEDIAAALYFTVFDVSLLPPSEYWAFHIGMLLQFPVTIKIFDLYVNAGLTAYPFKNILSLTAELGLSLSNFLLNHFACQTCIKANVDIPVFKNYSRHFLSLGSGLRYRGGFPLFNYMGVPAGYYEGYKTFFFEIAYRIKM